MRSLTWQSISKLSDWSFSRIWALIEAAHLSIKCYHSSWEFPYLLLWSFRFCLQLSHGCPIEFLLILPHLSILLDSVGLLSLLCSELVSRFRTITIWLSLSIDLLPSEGIRLLCRVNFWPHPSQTTQSVTSIVLLNQVCFPIPSLVFSTSFLCSMIPS